MTAFTRPAADPHSRKYKFVGMPGTVLLTCLSAPMGRPYSAISQADLNDHPARPVGATPKRTGRAGYFARPHDFSPSPHADAAVGRRCVGRSRENQRRIQGARRASGADSSQRPSALQHRCRTQGDRLSYEDRASWPAGLVFQQPLDLDIARNLGGDGWVLRDVSGPLEGGGVP